MAWETQNPHVVLLVVFTVLDTLAVGLRMYIRRVLTSAFGYDDIAMLITYSMLMVYVGLGITATYYGDGALDSQPQYDITKATYYHYVFEIICFTTSILVKISIALVLLRATSGGEKTQPMRSMLVIRHVITASIAACIVWGVVNLAVAVAGCQTLSSQHFSSEVCMRNGIAMQVMYILLDFFYALLPIAIMWNVQVSRWVKFTVVCLFSVGLIAAVATIMKLQAVITMGHAHGNKQIESEAWLQMTTWAIVEHGLAVFACAAISFRPLFRIASDTWTRLSGSMNSKSGGSGHQTSSALSASSDLRGNYSLQRLGTPTAADSFAARSPTPGHGAVEMDDDQKLLNKSYFES